MLGPWTKDGFGAKAVWKSYEKILKERGIPRQIRDAASRQILDPKSETGPPFELVACQGASHLFVLNGEGKPESMAKPTPGTDDIALHECIESCNSQKCGAGMVECHTVKQLLEKGFPFKLAAHKEIFEFVDRPFLAFQKAWDNLKNRARQKFQDPASVTSILAFVNSCAARGPVYSHILHENERELLARQVRQVKMDKHIENFQGFGKGKIEIQYAGFRGYGECGFDGKELKINPEDDPYPGHGVSVLLLENKPEFVEVKSVSL